MAFIFGLSLMGWETIMDKAEHIVVYGPAFALTGLPLARGVESLLDKLPWGKEPAPPPESPPPAKRRSKPKGGS